MDQHVLCRFVGGALPVSGPHRRSCDMRSTTRSTTERWDRAVLAPSRRKSVHGWCDVPLGPREGSRQLAAYHTLRNTLTLAFDPRGNAGSEALLCSQGLLSGLNTNSARVNARWPDMSPRWSAGAFGQDKREPRRVRLPPRPKPCASPLLQV